MPRISRRPLLALALTATLLGGFGLAVRQSSAAESPESAVHHQVAAQGERYAGACEQTVSPRDIGMLCSRLGGERDGVSAFLVGRAFSEFDRWLFVSRAEGDWRVIGESPLSLAAEKLEIPWP